MRIIDTDRGTKIVVNQANSKWIETSDVGVKVVTDYLAGQKFVGHKYDFIVDLESFEFFGPPPSASRANSLSRTIFEVTRKCNLRCVHCHQGNDKTDKGLLLEQIKVTIDNLAAHGPIELNMLGGEIFIRKDWLEILQYARNKAKVLKIVTNGTIISEEIASAVADLCDVVSVSLDGHDADTHEFIRGQGSFSKTISGIQLFQKAIQNSNCELKINHTVTAHNINNIRDIFEFCRMTGIRRLNIGTVFSHGSGLMLGQELDADGLRDQAQMTILNMVLDYPDIVVPWFLDVLHSLINPKRTYCQAAGELALIKANGDVVPCSFLSDIRITNVRENNWIQIFDSPVNPFYDMTVDRVYDCNTCVYRYSCGGACRADSRLHKGNFFSKPLGCRFSVYQHVLENIGKFENLFSVYGVERV